MLIVIEYENYANSHFRMNKEQYSVFPKEDEILFPEGAAFYVNDVRQNIEIEHGNDTKSITIIHLWKGN